jgi:hypothetical protein
MNWGEGKSIEPPLFSIQKYKGNTAVYNEKVLTIYDKDYKVIKETSGYCKDMGFVT